MGRRAVFFDRDGVLNRLVLNRATGEHEPPHRLQDLELSPDLGRLRALNEGGWLLFLVSNQPDVAKGKASFADLEAIHAGLHTGLQAAGAAFTAYYYCHHHPESLVPELKGPCECRKPSPFFIQRALREHGLDPRQCWMLGDQDSDVLCGQAAGLSTVLIHAPGSEGKRGASRPDEQAAGLAEALERLLARSNPNPEGNA